jgi:HTH-type transcriptional regulator/antitoxin HigA
MKYEINSKKAYHETMLAIYKLMDKGESNLSAAELKKLAAMSVAAEKYEDLLFFRY